MTTPRTRNGSIGVVRNFCDSEGKRVVAEFLDEVLSGEHGDAEIQRVWDSTSPSYQFSKPIGTRYFLELIRERIERPPARAKRA